MTWFRTTFFLAAMVIVSACSGSGDVNDANVTADADTTADADSEPTEWYGSREAGRLSDQLYEGLVRGCQPDSTDSIGRDLTAAVSSPELGAVFSNSIELIAVAEQACDDAELWRAEITSAMLKLLEASALMEVRSGLDLAPELTRAQLEERSSAEFLADVATLYDLIDWQISDTPNARAYRNRLWSGFFERGQAAELHGFRYSYQTFVTGSMTAWHAVDAQELGSLSNSDTVVVATPGAPFETAQQRAAEMMNSLADVKNVVLALSVSDFLANSQGTCEDLGDAAANAASAERSDAFAAVAEGLDVWNRQFVRRSNLITSPFFEPYDKVTKDGSFDGGKPVSEEVFDRRFERRAPLFEEWQICDEKVEALTEATEALLPRNITVVLLPLHPELISVAPDGVASIDELEQRVSDAVDEFKFVSFVDDFNADDFLDPTNLGPNAARQVSSTVAEVLEEFVE